MSTPFVGREQELERLGTIISRARRDRSPGAALVSGDPGSGKTRLLTELLERSTGSKAMRLGGLEPLQQIPFAAAAGLLSKLAGVPGSNLHELVFGGPESLARDPLRIFEAAHRAMPALGTQLLIIDDIQWIDQRSLALLVYLLKAAETTHRTLIVVAAARPSPEAAVFGAAIGTEMPVARRALVELGPLALDDGVSLVRAIDPGIDETAAAELWQRASGSPFWLDALARHARSDDRTMLIGDRLRGLSADAGALLAAIAVAGRPVDLADATGLLAWPTARMTGAARELVTRGMAIEVPGGLMPTHDLIREGVVALLPSAARRNLHARLAERIEAHAGDNLQLLGEALQHRRAAGLPAAPLAARLLASPQRRLLDLESLQLLGSISDELDRGSPEQVALDAALGELAAVLGAQELALDRWSRLSEHSHDSGARQRASIEAAQAAYRLRRPTEAHRHLDDVGRSTAASAEVFVRRDALRADVHLWLDHDTVAGARAAATALQAAEEMAARSGGRTGLTREQRRAYLAALEAAGDAAMQEDRLSDAARLSDRSVLVAPHLDDESYLAALMRAGFIRRPLGLNLEAIAYFRRVWDLAGQLTVPIMMVEAGHGLARCLRDVGRLAEAREIAAQTLGLERRLRHPPRWGNAASVMHATELSTGNTAAALRALERDAQMEPDPHYRLSIHQTIAVWRARYGSAPTEALQAEIAAGRAAADLAQCRRCSRELAIVSTEVLARIGLVDEAARELAAWDGHPTPDYPMRRVWRTRAQAAIAMSRTDVDAAVTLLNRLIAELTELELLEDLVWARLDLGRTLAQVDRGAAVAELTEAAALAQRIGAASQGRLVAQALRRLGVRTWRRGEASRGEGLDALSERERQVARLVADGHSNQEIAEALLAISPKTVERHVTNILAKLGLRNRTELAARVRSEAIGHPAPGTGFPR